MSISNALGKFNYLRSLKQIYFVLLPRLRILICSPQYIDTNVQIHSFPLSLPSARARANATYVLLRLYSLHAVCVCVCTCFFMPFQSTFIHSFMDTNRARLSFCFNGGGENRMKSWNERRKRVEINERRWRGGAQEGTKKEARRKRTRGGGGLLLPRRCEGKDEEEVKGGEKGRKWERLALGEGRVYKPVEMH